MALGGRSETELCYSVLLGVSAFYSANGSLHCSPKRALQEHEMRNEKPSAQGVSTSVPQFCSLMAGGTVSDHEPAWIGA